MECAREGCSDEATFELHIPWKANEAVCAGHARSAAHKEGVVADALDTANEELPGGATNQ